MVYVPRNAIVYNFAIVTFMASAINQGKLPSSTNPATYAPLIASAQAFAQSLDTNPGIAAGAITAQQQFSLYSMFSNITGVIGYSESTTPGDYDPTTAALIVMINAVAAAYL